MFSSQTLYNKQLDAIEAEKIVTGKVVALLFSAMWSPPCLQFIPKLRELYDELKSNRHLPFEVVFISTDKNKDEMHNFMLQHHGDWWATEFDSELST